MSAQYSRETIDVKFEALRHDFRADMNSLEGRLVERMATLEGQLVERMATLEGQLVERVATLDGRISGGIEGLRGEMKVWFLVMGTVIAVLSTGVGNRLIAVAWPQAPPGPTAPGGR